MLNVMFFSEPYLVLFIIMVFKQVYKELWWSRIFQLKASTRLCCMCAALQPSLWWVKNFLRHAVNSTVSIPRYGCPHPFSFINPCVNGVSLLLLFGLVFIYDTVCFVSSVRVTRGALGCWWWRPSSSLASMSIFLWGSAWSFRVCSLFSPSSRLATLGRGRSGGLRLDPLCLFSTRKFLMVAVTAPFPFGGGGGGREREEKLRRAPYSPVQP